MRLYDRFTAAIKAWSSGQVGAGGYYGSQAEQQYGYDGAYGHFYQLYTDYYTRLLDSGFADKTDYKTLSKAALSNPIAAACMRLITESLNEIEWEMVSEDDHGERTVKKDHPVLDLLYCEGERTHLELIQPVLHQLHYAGEIFMHRPIALTTSEFRPLGFDLICPSRFVGFVRKGIDEPMGFRTLIRAETYNKVMDGGIVGYKFSKSGEKTGLLWSDYNYQSIDTCKHHYLYCPWRIGRGLPLIFGSSDAITLSAMGTQWNTNLARTGGRIPGFFTPEGLKPGQSITPEQRTRIEADFDNRVKERQERNLPMVLSGTMKHVEANVNPREADWLGSDKHVGRKICATHRVPPILVGDVESVGLGGGSGTKSANKNFYQTALLPLLDVILQYFNHSLVKPFNDGYELCYNRDKIDALQEEEEKRDKRLVAACGGAFMTPNEARVRAGLEGLPDEEYDKIREQKSGGSGSGEEGEEEGEEGGSQEGRDSNNMNNR